MTTNEQIKKIQGANAEDLAKAFKLGANGDGQISEEWLMGFLHGIRWAKACLEISIEEQQSKSA